MWFNRRTFISIVLPILIAFIGAIAPEKSRLFAQTPVRSARQSAPIDLTGNWVSVVNEDWRWRMLTPPKGDYVGVPLNDAGRRVAASWDPSEDGSCKAYGVGGLMRMPIRVRITWESDETLKIESDFGLQVRHLYFANPPPTNKTLQGRSIALWEPTLPLGDGWGFGSSPSQSPGGSLKVTTTDMQHGWLRRNGVPYGERTRVTEYYDRFKSIDGTEWFVVTTTIDDSQYLVAPYTTSSHFRREPNDGAKWHPRACKG